MTGYRRQNMVDPVIKAVAVAKLHQLFCDISHQPVHIRGAKQCRHRTHDNRALAKPIDNKPHLRQPVRCIGNGGAIMVWHRDDFGQ